MSRKNQKPVVFDEPKKLLKGRLKCDCQAQLHHLINNCIFCGKIVCEQEGEGPCFFCGNKVSDKNKVLELQTDSEMMFPDLAPNEQSEYIKAVKHKDKLLDYHRKDIHQSQIYDDQTDYYQIADNVWEDDKIRSQAVSRIIDKFDQIDEENQGISIQFDPATKQLIEGIANQFDEDKFKDDAIKFQQQAAMEEYKEGQNSKQLNVDDRLFQNDLAKQLYEEIRSDLMTEKKVESKSHAKPKQTSRVQNQDFFESFQNEVKESINASDLKQHKEFDKEFYNLESEDRFYCLSMLQPWASLLVEGFKRVEGRFWNTEYRGPLWIHAGATPPTPEDISKLEYQYEQIYKNYTNRPQFPSRYPLGALIGLVDLVGVIDKETYESKVPKEIQEEGDTPQNSQFLYFLSNKFIVRNPRKLFYPISMRGDKNIFKITENIREQAYKLVQKVPTNFAPFPIEQEFLEQIEQKVKAQKIINAIEIEEQTQQEEEVKQQPQISKVYPKPKLVESVIVKQEVLQNFFIDNLTEAGFLVKNIMKSDEITQMAKLFEQKIPQQKSKKASYINIKSVVIPNIEELINSIDKMAKQSGKIKDKQYIQKSMGYVQVTFMMPKDRYVVVDEGAFCLMVIGDPVEIKIDNGFKGSYILNEGQAFISLIPKESLKVQQSKESNQQSTLKSLGQDYSYKSWVLVFGENL